MIISDLISTRNQIKTQVLFNSHYGCQNICYHNLGIDAHLIEVEVDVTVCMIVFNIVDLPDGTTKESRDRVLSAVKNSGFSFPVRRVVINLTPALCVKLVPVLICP